MSALVILISLLKLFEGCRLAAYQDVAGVWTIGWGETKGVKAGMQWTQAQADAALQARAQEFIDGVIAACPALANASPIRLAACASLAYNIGLSAFAKSTVCRMIKSDQHQAAADAFLLFCKAGGRIIKGLERRRRVERDYYLRG